MGHWRGWGVEQPTLACGFCVGSIPGVRSEIIPANVVQGHFLDMGQIEAKHPKNGSTREYIDPTSSNMVPTNRIFQLWQA